MQIRLREYQTSTLELTRANADELQKHLSSGSVAPSWSGEGLWDVRPGAQVGVVALGDTTVVIEPKIRMDRLLFLASYGIEHLRHLDEAVDIGSDATVVDAMALLFARATKAATRRGLLQGYRGTQETSYTVRGRIRFDEQLRRHFGRSHPIEVEYDDFTEDIEVNRRLYAALIALRHLPIAVPAVRRSLAALTAAFQGQVTPVDYSSDLPAISWTRLNDHYRPAVTLADLIIRRTSLEARHGALRSAGFTLNMNAVFERFVIRALRQRLGLDARSFPSQLGKRSLALDAPGKVGLEPDLSWWEDGRCVFVGDAKYKRVSVEGINHPDLYQLLAYMTALDLPSGLLVYAAGEADEVTHVLEADGRELRVAVLDVDGSPDAVLAEVDRVADIIRSTRVGAWQCDGDLSAHPA